MLLRSIAMFFVVAFFSGTGQAATILVWGDSLSAGYQLGSGQDWPTLLQTRLEQKGFPHTVVNASLSGETSAGGRTRLPAMLEEHQPDVLILGLGANDGLRGLRPQLMADNLDAMIAAARERGVRVLLIGMQLPPNYGRPYTQRFQETFHEVATRNGVPLVPFLLEGFAERPEMFLADGIHPNADAQQVILDTVWRQLRPMLDEKTEPQARR